MFALRYIDKNQFAISAIRDFNSMKTIIETTPERIKKTDEKMENSAKNESGKTAHKMIPQNENEKSIVSIDLVKKRYKNAAIYMEWFLPAWNSLKKQDQKILCEFYMHEDRRSGASIRLQHALNYSERQIDRFRVGALEALALLLLGE